MTYPNAYLRNFAPVFAQILKEKHILQKRLHLEIIDEEEGGRGIFEPAGVDEVLGQLADGLNHLAIYTDRPAHFAGFSGKMYEECGLVTVFFSKEELKRRGARASGETVVLDFEWEGACYFTLLSQGKNYIPIHKKPWKIAENLDIIVPFGYNTVIVKNRQMTEQKPVRDRFDEAFYAER